MSSRPAVRLIIYEAKEGNAEGLCLALSQGNKGAGISRSLRSLMGEGGFLSKALFRNTKEGGCLQLSSLPGSQAQAMFNAVLTRFDLQSWDWCSGLRTPQHGRHSVSLSSRLFRLRAVLSVSFHPPLVKPAASTEEAGCCLFLPGMFAFY